LVFDLGSYVYYRASNFERGIKMMDYLLTDSAVLRGWWFILNIGLPLAVLGVLISIIYTKIKKRKEVSK
jgi:hypothetical protein